MLAKHVWDELRPIWTTGPPSIPGVFGGYWDDWYATPQTRWGTYVPHIRKVNSRTGLHMTGLCHRLRC
jgi:hypothetical protein